MTASARLEAAQQRLRTVLDEAIALLAAQAEDAAGPIQPVTADRKALSWKLSDDTCACGCAWDRHENYGEDGYSCDHPDHVCVPTSSSVLGMLQDLRTQVAAQAEADDIYICPACGGNGTVPIYNSGGSRIGVSVCVQCSGRGELLDRPKTEPASPDVLRDLYVPGVWKCPHCEFQLARTTLNVVTGEASVTKAQIEETEPCPNDGTWMVRVLWRERANEAVGAWPKLVDDICALTGAPSLPQALDGLKREAGPQPAGARPTWQPIETAPNGVLGLCCDMHAVELRHWACVGWRHSASAKGCVTTSERANCPATHWMPLPAPPARPEGGQP